MCNDITNFEMLRKKSLYYKKRAATLEADGDLYSSLILYQRAMDIDEKLASITNTSSDRFTFAVLCYKIAADSALGKRARLCYAKKGLTTSANLKGENPTCTQYDVLCKAFINLIIETVIISSN